jgi:hypothetical protein
MADDGLNIYDEIEIEDMTFDHSFGQKKFGAVT